VTLAEVGEIGSGIDSVSAAGSSTSRAIDPSFGPPQQRWWRPKQVVEAKPLLCAFSTRPYNCREAPTADGTPAQTHWVVLSQMGHCSAFTS
jgi:hypothetical protein